MAGIQPSLIYSYLSTGDSEYGFGVRSLNTYYNDHWMIFFDPLLGYINSEWEYHIKLGAAYRVTPGFYIGAAWEHRDVLDLNDLELSNNALESAMIYIGFRIN